ncbi:hypothetical protein J437_LFUL012658 [Ladona fulva]|uniref:Ferritin-like diiron domain-containing protein n=1 Tax=Ladona fulva TaxID=123851 RepID=A0A8K0KCU6_LADFU|nr:hypothetical protein J437_LFUL012658 [Ladona fulva]
MFKFDIASRSVFIGENIFIMKVFILFLSLVAIVASEYCYDSVVSACGKTGVDRNLENCHARYGAVDELAFELQNFANLHITRSFDYLLFATHFGAYQKNREGFGKFFRKLSDDTWEDAIDIIKYITKRGGKMDFESKKQDTFMFVSMDNYFYLSERCLLA